MTKPQVIPNDEIDYTGLIIGEPMEKGQGFQALSFREKQFNGLMDPLIMVDHFTMTQPTFGTHPHAGIAAVTVLFEDSDGEFYSQDSLGNHLDLRGGDLYWLNAGRGAVHDEAPRPGARAHGLQLFVNLPARLKHAPPSSRYVSAAEIPIINGNGYRVRVVLGSSGDVVGPQSPTIPLTILDATLEAEHHWTHTLGRQECVWVHAVSGDVSLRINGRIIDIPHHQAIALRNEDGVTKLTFQSSEDAHFVVISGEPIKEQFVQKGPFVMSTQEQLVRVQEDYLAGCFGSIE